MLRSARAILFSLMLIPFAGWAMEPVNINTADAATLEQVKGIGPALARKIVEYRTAHGAFASVNDLVKIPGIGEKSVQNLGSQLTVGAAAAAPAAKAVTAKK